MEGPVHQSRAVSGKGLGPVPAPETLWLSFQGPPRAGAQLPGGQEEQFSKALQGTQMLGRKGLSAPGSPS